MARTAGLTAFIILIFIFCIANADEPAAPAGHWEGKITIQPGVELGVLVDLSRDAAGVWSGEIDIPVQSAKDLSLTNIKLDEATAEFEISGIPGTPTFRGKFSADQKTLSGDFTQAGRTYPFTLTRSAAPPAPAAGISERETLDEIRDHIKKTMADWHVPGLAVAIIKSGKVILSEGFGVRNIKTSDPVTPSTLFAIGSSSKAFTATLMGIAVDEGKLKWNDPVRKYIPSFDLQDEFAEARMTPRDLLSHRSGLPRHDVVWYGASLSRKEMFDRLKHLEPSEDFRTTFQYQNLMFLTAGYLEEQLYGGTPWEKLLKDKIFDPLGMSSSNTSVNDIQKAGDYALPYEYKAIDDKTDKKEIREISFRNIDAVGPAGSINSNLNDMTRWLQMNLNAGSLEDKRVISAAALEEIHSPQMIVRGGIFAQLFSHPETPYLMYGMGWFLQPYRGYRLLHHGGNIDGFSAMVSFMPDDKHGVILLSNLDGNIQVNSLMFEIYDRLLGLEPVDWNSRYKLVMAQIEAANKESGKKEDEVRRKKGTNTSHSLSDFSGTYEHAAYGKMTVQATDDKLVAYLHGIDMTLEHFHYDVFRATKDPVKGLKLSFSTNLRGDIDRVSVPLEQGVDNIVFTRLPPVEMKSARFLSRFTGEYELMGLSVVVELKEDHLTLTVPGQPTYTLEPYGGTEFDLKDQKGYSVKFTMDKDRVTEAVFIQPNGVFTAKRK